MSTKPGCYEMSFKLLYNEHSCKTAEAMLIQEDDDGDAADLKPQRLDFKFSLDEGSTVSEINKVVVVFFVEKVQLTIQRCNINEAQCAQPPR